MHARPGKRLWEYPKAKHLGTGWHRAARRARDGTDGWYRLSWALSFDVGASSSRGNRPEVELGKVRQFSAVTRWNWVKLCRRGREVTSLVRRVRYPEPRHRSGHTQLAVNHKSHDRQIEGRAVGLDAIKCHLRAMITGPYIGVTWVKQKVGWARPRAGIMKRSKSCAPLSLHGWPCEVHYVAAIEPILPRWGLPFPSPGPPALLVRQLPAPGSGAAWCPQRRHLPSLHQLLKW